MAMIPSAGVARFRQDRGMKRSKECPKCHGKDIIADAKVIDLGHGNLEKELTVATFSKPEAMFFRGKATSTVSAWVCRTCGFTEFYADTPGMLGGE
jgi:predicted nucleic-acid-binding Zn-ribbon protein